MMSSELPGMPAHDWRALEGRAMKAEATETGDIELHREANETILGAEEDKNRVGLEKLFRGLYPGEEPPEDIGRLDYLVQKSLGNLSILGLGDEEEEGEEV